MARFRDDMLAYYQEDSMGAPTIDDVIAQLVAQQAPQAMPIAQPVAQPTSVQEIINQIVAQQSQPMRQPEVQQMAQQVDLQNETTGQPLLDRSNIEQVIAQITQQPVPQPVPQPVQQPTPVAQPVASKSDVIANLTSQIQAQGTTSNWTGGVGADKSANDMAKILADTGITDINQFGKIQKVEPVEVTGYSLNGNNVQRTSENSYYEQIPEYDSEGGVTYRRRDLSPQEIAQVKTSYGVVEQTGDENNPQVIKPASEVTMKDGQLVGVTGETFGNKLTGQEVPQTYSERQTGEFFGGTFEGKGNTGYGVKFGADGTPIFYAQGASSTDKLVTTLMPMVQIALAATGAGGVLGNALLGTGANQVLASALGGAILGGGTSAIAGQDAVKGALLGGAGGAASQYLSGVLSGLDTPAGLTDRQLAIADATQLAASGIPQNQISEILTAGGYNDAIVSRAMNAISATPTVAPTPTAPDNVVVTAPSAPSNINEVINTIISQQPIVTPVPEPTPSNAVITNAPLETVQVTAAPTTAPTPTIAEVINAIVAQQPTPAPVTPPVETVNVEAPKAQPEKPQTVAEVINAIAAPPVAPVVPVAPEIVVTGQAPIKEPKVSPTFPITMSPTAPTVVPQEPIKVEKEKKWTAGELADLARLGLLATTIFGVADSGGGPTQYDIVPVPADWKSPVYQKDLPANAGAMTQLPAIDFGDRNLLIGTQWEKFLDPNYGQVPAPIQFGQPSNLSYQDLMGILGSKASMPASSTLSINDVISGIQNQYGQIPSGSMGQKPT
jgi:hypothetical protein